MKGIPMNDLHATTGSGQGRRRKLAAVLAGGLVLTTGAVTTLASWSDSEFAGATFSSGQFDLEGSIDGGDSFGQHFKAAQAGQLAFDLNVNNLAPGDTVNASFPVRLAAGTTNNARLRLAAATVTGSITGLGVIVWQNTLSADCSAAYNPSFLVAYVDSTTFGPAIQPTLSKGSPTSSAGAPVNVCFRVAASDSLPQAQSGSVSFQFVATSQ
jgi:predicted ribosomally synthesized peptide with SipW-like signal peptide